MRDIVRWICGTVVLILLFSRWLPVAWPVVLSSVLAAGILTLGLSWSEANIVQGFLAVLCVYFAVGYINTLDEALFFHLETGRQLAAGLLGGLLVSVALAAVLVIAPPLRVSRAPAAKVRSNPWLRIPLLACAYVAIYFAAGLLVRPYVITFYMRFYHGRPLPGLGDLLIVEALRGLLYLAAAWPWLRLLQGNRLNGALFLGAAYSILGGIAPLLLPNPLMPGNIRLAHGVEIGISNFIFGALVAWTLTGKRAPLANPKPQPALQ